jgi:hypothetical protein
MSTHSSPRALLRQTLVLTELKLSNPMIEAWWVSLLPHSAFRGQTPDEMYFGTGDAVPAGLTSSAAAARRARVEANRSAACETCRSQSKQPPDDRVLAAPSDQRTADPYVWKRLPGEPGTTRRSSRRPVPCPVSESLPGSSRPLAA